MLTRRGGRKAAEAPRAAAGTATVPVVSLIFHWGGARHGEVADVPAEWLASAVLVYDGPRWFGVYERFEPVRTMDTAQGPAEVWVVRE